MSEYGVVRGADGSLNIPGIIDFCCKILRSGVVREISACRERFQIVNRHPEVVTEILDYFGKTIKSHLTLSHAWLKCACLGVRHQLADLIGQSPEFGLQLIEIVIVGSGCQQR